MDERDKGFIERTASDYDMEVWEVEKIYNKTEGGPEFYEDLEVFIKDRRERA